MRLIIAIGLFCIIACKSEKKSDKTEPFTVNSDSCRQVLDFINGRLSTLESELDRVKKLATDPDSQLRLKTKDTLFQLLKEKRDEIQKKCDSLK